MWYAAGTVSTVASSMHDAHELRGIFQAQRGNSYHMCELLQIYEDYCSIHVGCHRRRVGCHSLCTCCIGDMWDVTAPMLAAQALCGLLHTLHGMLHPLCGIFPSMHSAQALCGMLYPLYGMSLANTGNED